MDRIDDDIRALSRYAVYAMPETVLTTLVGQIQACTSRLAAFQAAVVREIDGRGIVKKSGSVNASAWLRDRARISIHAAHQVTAAGAVLDARPSLAAAVIEGDLTPEQAVIVGGVLDDLPADLDAEQVEIAEAMLLGYASRFEPRILKQCGARILAHVAPDLADEALRKRLADAERRANRERHLTLSPDGSGRTRLSGVLDTVSAATVAAALSPLMRPLPAGPAGADARTPGARRADALVEVCRLALRTGELPADGGQPPQINVTIDFAALAGAVRAGMLDHRAFAATTAGGFGGHAACTHTATGLRDIDTATCATCGNLANAAGARTSRHAAHSGTSGTLDTGEPISAATVRRIACDARILPVVLDGAGIPIDIGRARRLYTGAARVAVLLRDGGCAFPGCDRPPKWCDIHHMVSWVDGGRTDRDNGVALCGYHHRLIHHRLIHHSAWTVFTDTDGRPTFIPPIDIDPDQKPCRNPYHLRT